VLACFIFIVLACYIFIVLACFIFIVLACFIFIVLACFIFIVLACPQDYRRLPYVAHIPDPEANSIYSFLLTLRTRRRGTNYTL
jgi:accessory gene regulator protein AgrB